MTALWGVKSIRLATQKHEKTEKVTGSQDDGFVGVKSIRLATQKTRKDRKSPGSQDKLFGSAP